jgi:hypothetical protein
VKAKGNKPFTYGANTMELLINDLMEIKDRMYLFYGSVATHGTDAGLKTWKNALDFAKTKSFMTEAQHEDFVAYFKEFGAWTEQELRSWDTATKNALLLQHIASEILDLRDCDSYEQYQERAEQGQISGNIFRTADDWYIQLSH